MDLCLNDAQNVAKKYKNASVYFFGDKKIRRWEV